MLAVLSALQSPRGIRGHPKRASAPATPREVTRARRKEPLIVLALGEDSGETSYLDQRLLAGVSED